MMRHTWRFVRCASLVALTSAGGCLPIPNRVTDVVDVSGRLLRAGQPVPGKRLSVEQPHYIGPGEPGACSGAAPVRTDSVGRFHSPRRRKWQPWISLLGESPEWHIPVRVCVEESTGWQELYLTHANGWDPPLDLVCDVALVPARDSLTTTRGRCTNAAAAAPIAR